VFSTGATGCVPTGAGAKYGACTQLGECQAGLECLFGVCVPFCDLTADCADRPGQQCQQVEFRGADGGIVAPPSFKVCTAQCALENPSAVCGAGVTCGLVSDTSPATDCFNVPGTGTDGADCSANGFADCGPGFVCITTTPSDGGAPRDACRHWCRVGYGSDCPVAGSTCRLLNNSPMVGAYTYGICCPPGGC
jgi:hypothetical protein